MSPLSRSACIKPGLASVSLPLLLCLAGCPDEKGVPLQLAVGNQPSNEVCDIGTSTLTTVAPKTVRLTVVQRTSATDPGTFVCDKLLNVPDHPTFRIPMPKGPLDLYAEAFADADAADPNIARAGTSRRVATGVTYNIDNKTKVSQSVRLYRSQDWSCAPPDGGNGPGLALARAFHSATALPNHQVLIVGGVIANPTPGMSARVNFLDNNFVPLWPTGSVEVYDADSGKLLPVSDSAAVPRAFHSAVLLSATAPYQILLIGGFNSSDPSKPILQANDGSQDGWRFVPRDLSGSLVKPPLPTKAVAAEILTYDPAAGTITHTPLATLSAAALQAVATRADLITLAGGIDYTPAAAVDATHAREVVSGSLTNISSFRVGMSNAPHAAGALALVTANLGVLWGGALDATGNAGELLTGLASNGSGTPLVAAGAALVEFPTATLVASNETAGSGTVLVTGGFVVDASKRTVQPPPGFGGVQLVNVASNAATVAPASVSSDYAADCASPNRYRPAGWESAVALGDGRVLVTGGAPSNDVTCNNCELTGPGSKATCATHQASLYEGGQLIPAPKKMGLARAGHTSTLLADGTVLVAGGVSLGANGPVTVRELELYNPRHYTPPVMQPTDSDPDDPVAAVLKAAGATRVAGAVAQLNGKPLAVCPDL